MASSNCCSSASSGPVGVVEVELVFCFFAKKINKFVFFQKPRERNRSNYLKIEIINVVHFDVVVEMLQETSVDTLVDNVDYQRNDQDNIVQTVVVTDELKEQENISEISLK